MNTQFLTVLLILFSLAGCNSQQSDKSKSDNTQTDFAIIEISWDSSYFNQKYKLTNTEFSFCLSKASTEEDSCMFKKSLNNHHLFEFLKRQEIKESYMNEEGYYSNGIQKITLSLNQNQKQIWVQDFKMKPIDKIREVVNTNLPKNLKSKYAIK